MNAQDMDEIIALLAREHGVVLSKGDPVLILVTINRLLLQELASNQLQITREFREALETSSHDWERRANKRAEAVLNAAVVAAKNAVATGAESGLQAGMDSLLMKVDKSVQRMESLLVESRRLAGMQKGMALFSTVALIVSLVLFFAFR